jgi:hypothetical protein
MYVGRAGKGPESVTDRWSVSVCGLQPLQSAGIKTSNPPPGLFYNFEQEKKRKKKRKNERKTLLELAQS